MDEIINWDSTSLCLRIEGHPAEARWSLKLYQAQPIVLYGEKWGKRCLKNLSDLNVITDTNATTPDFYTRKLALSIALYSHVQTNSPQTLPSPYAKFAWKWIRDIKLRANTLKLLKENKGEKILMTSKLTKIS